jgi:SEC-C motif
VTIEDKKSEIRRLLPSEYMRARRPHLFSDTEEVQQAQLDKATFEYHLDTLTARKQELDFEHFARKLAEKELCPNLRPQTGPTGGGDSKVDSETYPVSLDIANRGYHGDAKGQKGATEPWAFAFSAKKDWRGKVRSDIKSIAETGRGYTVAYFITSRFARDKDRASLEDELRKKYQIDVHILDRTWIVEKVLDNGRERLATETLRLNIPLAATPQKGPRDVSRQAELKELDQQIADPDRYSGLNYQLVEDSLQSALLARGLELPRLEVEGRFERASRLAEEHGTAQQQLRCAYNRAWTYFWWYDDFRSFNRAYEAVEKLVRDNPQLSDLELLQNLWTLLHVSVRDGRFTPAEARLDERTAALETKLAHIRDEQSRPNAALHANASILLMNALKSYGDIEKLKLILQDFRGVFQKSNGLIDFPALRFAEILMELGECLSGDEGFDEIFESVLAITRERNSSVVAGRMLLRRGIQKLKAKRPYEAIRLLGRAQQDLALHESRGEMAAALGACSSAYEEAGLPWAAHCSALLAANQALKTFHEDGKVTVQAVACVRGLIWLELRLGRVPCALAWIEMFLVLEHTLGAHHDEERQSRLTEEWRNIDGLLGALLLKSDIFDLKNLAFLPEVLDQFNLEASRMALLYALGYEDRLRADNIIPAGESPEAVLAFFKSWAEQLSLNEMPELPDFLDGQTIELRSAVLGCDVRLTVPNIPKSLLLAEAILGGLESFLATSLDSPLLPYTSRLQLRIVPRDFVDEPLTFSATTSSRTIIEIYHPKDDLDAEERPGVMQDKLVELISTITAHIATPADEKSKFFEALIRDERGFGRALLITNVKTIIANTLGDKPKFRTSDWEGKQPQSEGFPLIRTEPWIPTPAGRERTDEREAWTPGKGDPPAALLDTGHLKHGDRKIFSLIENELWNRVGWAGTGFGTPQSSAGSPFLMLLFKDMKAATSIFEGWRQELGRDDLSEKLRISVVTGVSRENPFAYRVVLGTNPNWLTADKRKPSTQFVMVSRINEMTPRSSANLDRFLEAYRNAQRYLLLPAQAGVDEITGLAPDLGITKRELFVRRAFEIGRHDPESIAIYPDDKVIIPDGVSDAPVLEVLQRKKQNKGAWRPNATPAAKVRAGTPHQKVGRNDPCPCGSGKKYKKCCGG